jgi:hypothetical protein
LELPFKAGTTLPSVSGNFTAWNTMFHKNAIFSLNHKIPFRTEHESPSSCLYKTPPQDQMLSQVLFEIQLFRILEYLAHVYASVSRMLSVVQIFRQKFCEFPFFALSPSSMVHVTLNIGYRESANTIVCVSLRSVVFSTVFLRLLPLVQISSSTKS